MLTNTAFVHESLYRKDWKRLREMSVTICGAGALGANIAENLARCGVASFTIIDKDRVEERNLSTQPYYRSDIGSFKARAMANALYRALGVEVEPVVVELKSQNIEKFLGSARLVVDTFDNSVSRSLVKSFCQEHSLKCLHVGLSSDYGEVIWNDVYRVPSAVNDDVCDYPLARNLVMLTTVVATEALIAYITMGICRSYTITAADMRVVEYAL